MTYKTLGNIDSTPDQHTGLLAEYKRQFGLYTQAVSPEAFLIERVVAILQDFEAANVLGTLKERCAAKVAEDPKAAAILLGVDTAIDTDTGAAAVVVP